MHGRSLGRPLGAARGARRHLRAARAAAAVRASRPACATCTKHVRAVPARPLGSGTCAALPGGACSGCAGGVPESAPAADAPQAPENHLVLRGAGVIFGERRRSAWRAGWRWKGGNELRNTGNSYKILIMNCVGRQVKWGKEVVV